MDTQTAEQLRVLNIATDRLVLRQERQLSPAEQFRRLHLLVEETRRQAKNHEDLRERSSS
jgi:hypothetical protein